MLASLLNEKRDAIITQWRSRIVDTYPSDSANFLTNRKNQFANPVGHAIREQTEVLFDELVGGESRSVLAQALDKIIRIRAVQEFTPAQATAFVYLLKDVIYEQVRGSLNDARVATELRKLEGRIDRLALLAFDLYTLCRDQMAQIKVNEAKRRTYKMVDHLNRRGIDIDSLDNEDEDDNEEEKH
ncbi:MAG TPA: RsbRD N-terminal domain-containing protein [candidate division Zixibacteria bacterium]|nr:RsbRD N-terminal domain-containing protein [candidate division Zixibacteria bacterium]